MIMFCYIYLLIIILVSVAFFTLLERKLLGYGHIRVGPNKVGWLGVLQPFSDAIKLFTKMVYRLEGFNMGGFMLMPVVGLTSMLVCWIFYIGYGGILQISSGFLLLFCLLSIGVYFILGKGWFSGSVYSLMGGYRSCAQAISYEISMVFLIVLLMFFFGQLEGDCFYFNGDNFFWGFLFLMVFFIGWGLMCLCESNRSPFDLSEGESELVSGFNTEYGGGLFSLIFISEYGSIVFLGYLSGLLFLGGGLSMGILVMVISFMFVLIRLTYPRIRYDALMSMAWKMLLLFIILSYFSGLYW